MGEGKELRQKAGLEKKTRGEKVERKYGSTSLAREVEIQKGEVKVERLS